MSGPSIPAPEHARARDLAAALAVEAGEILLTHVGQIAAAKVGRKSSVRDLVTAADVASERHLVSVLRRHFPDHRIEAEEEAKDAPARGVPRWFLDPLDGTVNFVHGLPFYAVSLGLWLDDEPLVAVVHAPRLGETFCAARGHGATLNGVPLAVSGATELSEALLATGFPYRLGSLPNDNLGNFARLAAASRGLRRCGSAALDLAYTAAGRFDGFWELHLEPHDVAAGGLLVLEAGGAVSDLAGGPDWLRGRSIAAAGPGLHGALLALLDGP
ncbi:MAG: inositol monophosphatase [Planctomycetaceae bacterium]|nr:inositol monophosphatase [Planctomycetaceae bacterium]